MRLPWNPTLEITAPAMHGTLRFDTARCRYPERVRMQQFCLWNSDLVHTSTWIRWAGSIRNQPCTRCDGV
jgi:hypothetical protein